jgi:hypothetical protein
MTIILIIKSRYPYVVIVPDMFSAPYIIQMGYSLSKKINDDIEALKASDVGLGMGSGCSAVKAASDLIHTNDDFEACLKSIMWGRNIYHNVSRFL